MTNIKKLLTLKDFMCIFFMYLCCCSVERIDALRKNRARKKQEKEEQKKRNKIREDALRILDIVNAKKST